MKTTLQNILAIVAPSISIVTEWEHDPSPSEEIFKPGWALHGQRKDRWQCWQSEVKATVIEAGAIYSGSGYLSGTWERANKLPENSNPEISGYENQLTVEALEELRGQITDTVLLSQIESAIAKCGELARAAYEIQRKEIEAAK